MADILGNGAVTFGDGTSLNSATVAWSSFSGVPTNLSQFTNDLGNYGSFLTPAANVYNGYSPIYDPNGVINACGSKRGKIGHMNSTTMSLYWNGTYPTIAIYNCNCNCNC